MQATKSKPKLDWVIPVLKSVWPFFAGLLFVFFFSQDAYLTETGYSTALFPILTQATTIIGGFLPASMAELVMGAGILFVIVMAVRFSLNLRSAKKKDRGRMAFEGVLMAVQVAAYIYLAFAVLCVPNYYRHSFTYYSGHVVKAGTVAELTDLATILGERAGDVRESVYENEQGQMLLTGNSIYDVAKQARTTMEELAETYPILAGKTPQPKPVSFSFVLSKLGLSGFYFPFFAEANFNAHMPAADMPFTMLHELAHAHGFMREEEANFIAYLACRDSESPDFAYSANLNALRYCLNALGREDADAYWVVWNGLSEPVRRDITQVRDYWAEHDGTLSEVSNKVNDTYLKVNNQSDGTKSYGRVVDLLLAEYRTWPEAQV